MMGAGRFCSAVLCGVQQQQQRLRGVRVLKGDNGRVRHEGGGGVFRSRRCDRESVVVVWYRIGQGKRGQDNHCCAANVALIVSSFTTNNGQLVLLPPAW